MRPLVTPSPSENMAKVNRFLQREVDTNAFHMRTPDATPTAPAGVFF
jgi:hypothetical protein